MFFLGSTGTIPLAQVLWQQQGPLFPSFLTSSPAALSALVVPQCRAWACLPSCCFLKLVFMSLCRRLLSLLLASVAWCRCLSLDFVPSIQLNPWTCLLNPKLVAVADTQNRQKSSKVDVHCWLTGD